MPMSGAVGKLGVDARTPLRSIALTDKGSVCDDALIKLDPGPLAEDRPDFGGCPLGESLGETLGLLPIPLDCAKRTEDPNEDMVAVGVIGGVVGCPA